MSRWMMNLSLPMTEADLDVAVNRHRLLSASGSECGAARDVSCHLAAAARPALRRVFALPPAVSNVVMATTLVVPSHGGLSSVRAGNPLGGARKAVHRRRVNHRRRQRGAVRQFRSRSRGIAKSFTLLFHRDALAFWQSSAPHALLQRGPGSETPLSSISALKTCT